MQDQSFTLIFIKKDNKVLLGLKRRGFGQGKWNGYGGKIEQHESICEGAIRELKEESNLEVQREDLQYLGYVVYKEEHNNAHKRVVYIFVTQNFRGDLRVSEEMEPHWFAIGNLPYNAMWPDSRYWVPLVLEEWYLRAEFVYDDKCEIVSQTVTKLEKDLAEVCPM